MTKEDCKFIIAGVACFYARKGIIQRCENPNNDHYNAYGGRGITICKGWRNSDEKFIMDMGVRPSENHSVERIDNHKGYWCGNCDECRLLGRSLNCCWATKKVQCNNRRSNRVYLVNGERKTAPQMEEISGIPSSIIRSRIKYGWSIERAISEPVKTQETIIEFNGKSQNISSWARDIGVAPQTMLYRISKHGIEKALNRGSSVRNKKFFVLGKGLTIREWSRKTGVPYQTIYCRIGRGQTMEQALGIKEAA